MFYVSLQDVLNHSDSQAVLQLVNLVAGRYIFTLTVVDGEGLTSSDQASVLVKEGSNSVKKLKKLMQSSLFVFLFFSV